jgi:hypothetical protein
LLSCDFRSLTEIAHHSSLISSHPLFAPNSKASAGCHAIPRGVTAHDKRLFYVIERAFNVRALRCMGRGMQFNASHVLMVKLPRKSKFAHPFVFRCTLPTWQVNFNQN